MKYSVNKTTVNKTKGNGLKFVSFIASVFMLSVNIIILVYLNRLKKCNCDLEKKHNLLKGLAIYSLVIPFVSPFISLLIVFIKNRVLSIALSGLVFLSMIFLSGLYIYTLFNYVDDIDESKCSCLDDDNLRGLHNFLYVWRYISVFIYVFLLVIFAYSIIMLFSNYVTK